MTLLATPAGACQPHDKVEAMLAKEFREYPIVWGQNGDSRSMFEYFYNEGTGSWSIVLTDMDGVSCIVGRGRDIENRRRTKRS